MLTLSSNFKAISDSYSPERKHSYCYMKRQLSCKIVRCFLKSTTRVIFTYLGVILPSNPQAKSDKRKSRGYVHSGFHRGHNGLPLEDQS